MTTERRVAQRMRLSACLMSAVLLAGACSVERKSGGGVVDPTPLPSVRDSAGSGGAFVGSWTSAVAGASAADPLSSFTSCTDFRLNVTEQQGNSASGTFSTICQGAYQVSGTANGTLDNNALHIVLQATANLPGVGACPVTVTSDATLDGDLIRLPYVAQTCVGAFSGTEHLRKSDLLPKPPAPEPEPPPAPAPPPPPPSPAPPPPADELNLNTVNIVLGPDVRSWPQTSTIIGARTGGSQLCINHTHLGRWPTVGFFDTGAPIEGNQWVFANIGGTWYGGAGEWIRPGQECKAVDADTIGVDAFAGRPGLGSWRPRPGEVFGVMVSTPARAWPSMRTIDHRSNIVFVRWQP